MELPLEVRIMIYKEIVVEPRKLKVDWRSGQTPLPEIRTVSQPVERCGRGGRGDWCKPIPAITMVCKQIREEACEVYFQENRFGFARSASYIYHWLEMKLVLKHLHLIKEITFLATPYLDEVRWAALIGHMESFLPLRVESFKAFGCVGDSASEDDVLKTAFYLGREAQENGITQGQLLKKLIILPEELEKKLRLYSGIKPGSSGRFWSED